MTDKLLDTDEVRKRHYEPMGQTCDAPKGYCFDCGPERDWPCDAIRLADALDEARKRSDWNAAEVDDLQNEMGPLKMSLEVQAKEIARLREALEVVCDWVQQGSLCDSDPPYRIARAALGRTPSDRSEDATDD